MSYLLPSDAMTMDKFNDSKLSSDYFMEMVNLWCSKYESKNYLFDLFSKFGGYEDSTFLQLHMLNYIADNNAKTDWDTYILLALYDSNLASWCARITDSLNKGDELCMYTLCNMFKQHAFIFTRTKPWTTVEGSIADWAIAEQCMICDVHLIFLGDNNYGELKYKPHITSPLSLPTAKNTDGKSDDNMDSLCNQTQSSDTSTGVIVGILNKDLNSRTVVTLPQSPLSIKLEAAKGLLALKTEYNIMNQQPEKSPSVTTTESQPMHTETSDKQVSTPQIHVSLSGNDTEGTSHKENTEMPTTEEPSQVVETTTSTDPAVQNNSPPGHVVIFSLPSWPVTPKNLHPANKPMESAVTKITPPSTVQNGKTNQVENKTSPTKNTVQMEQVKLCRVRLARLTDEELQRLCGLPSTLKTYPKPGVEHIWTPPTQTWSQSKITKKCKFKCFLQTGRQCQWWRW